MKTLKKVNRFYSKDYTIFHFLGANRAIMPNKVRALRESIKMYGLLRPIVCVILNEIMYIIDGQNTFKALESEGFEVEYIIVDVKSLKLAVTLMATLNSTATSWKTFNYCHAFSTLEMRDYTRLLLLYYKYNYPITDIARISSGGIHGSNINNIIKRGDFTFIRTLDRIERIIGYIEDILGTLPPMNRLKMSNVVRAFTKYYNLVETYDHAAVMQRVIEKHDLLLTFVEERAFYEIFSAHTEQH